MSPFSSSLHLSSIQPIVTVWIIPGNSQPGELETLCLDSVAGDAAMSCVDQYRSIVIDGADRRFAAPRCWSRATVFVVKPGGGLPTRSTASGIGLSVNIRGRPSLALLLVTKAQAADAPLPLSRPERMKGDGAVADQAARAHRHKPAVP